MSLPTELREEIAFHVDSHKDLIALALVCSAWKEIIIPDQSQYRVIRIREDMYDMWDLLARRPRLARAVKVLHLYDLYGVTPQSMYPKPVDNAREDDKQKPGSLEKMKVSNMCQALRHMTALREFAWNIHWGEYHPLPPSSLKAIFFALTQCKSLAHLVLLGSGDSADMDHVDWVDFPVWVFEPEGVVAGADALGLQVLEDIQSGDADHPRPGVGQSNKPHVAVCIHHVEGVSSIAGQHWLFQAVVQWY